MKKDQENLMFFIRNKKNKIGLIIVAVIVLFTLFSFGYYLFQLGNDKINKAEQRKKEELDQTLTFLYPNIDESIEYKEIKAADSTKLMNYFSNKKGDSRKVKFWNQTCLFYQHRYCIQFSIYWGLKTEHNKIREQYFLEGQNNLHLLIEGKKNTEENRCYVIFYKTQNDLNENKKNFLDNYKTCRKYYIENVPALIEYEENFLKIFK